MNELFLTPTIEKQATYHPMSRDYTQWVKDIVTKFLEDFPFLQNSPMSVVWTKKDPAKGYAVGSLRVLGAQVPVIIKDWGLAPMDVLVYPGGYAIPLTESILKEILTEPTPFKGIMDAKNKSNLALFGDELSDLQWSPTETDTDYTSSQETSTVRDAVKVSSFIDRLTIDKTAAKEMLTEIKNNPEILENFNNNGTTDIFEKISKAVVFSSSNEAEEFVRNLDPDLQMVWKDNYGNCHLKLANHAVDYVWDVDVNPEEAESVIEKMAACSTPSKKQVDKKKANAFKVSGKKAYLYITEDKKWNIFDDSIIKQAHHNIELNSDKPNIGDTGVWLLNDEVSMPFEIVGISKNAEFEKANFYKLANRPGYLVINEKGEWATGDTVFEKTASILELEGSDPKVDDFGCWVVGDVASVPFEITGMQKISTVGGWKIDAFDGIRKVSYYPVRSKNSSLISHDFDKVGYYVPGNAKFVKLDKTLIKESSFKDRKAIEDGIVEIHGFDGINKLSFYLTRKENNSFVNNSPNSYYIPQNANFIKLSSKLVIDAPSFVEPTAFVEKDSVGLYNLIGQEFNKYANRHEIRNLDLNSVRWSLMHLGASADDIEKVANLKNGFKLALYSELSCPVSPDTIISKIKSNYDKSVVKLAKLTKNLVKQASVINDEGTVDAILSLGLLRKNNIAEYLELIPDYERVLGELAKLLITTRLGMTQLPEEYVRDAMMSLTDVVEVLRGIKASVTKN